MQKLENLLKDEVGIQNYENTKLNMEKYWNKEVKNIRDFFNLIDARISEHKHFGGSEEMLNLQR
jgi:hypothetical protein